MLDLSNVPQHYVDDVQEFIDDNQENSEIRGKVVAELGPDITKAAPLYSRGK